MKTENIKIKPQWHKSKEEIWDEVFSDLDEPKTVPKTSNFSFMKYAAAIIILVVAGGAFAYLHKTTEATPRGTHATIILPDGSSVKMNAESEVSYKPYWWFISRKVELKGEAFFEVKPGSRFSVKSHPNEVSVLGTSFNIFARSPKYSVTCLTGKVEVKANNEKRTLTPNMQLNLRNGLLDVSENENTQQSIGWTQNKFSFIGVPLPDVIQEIERQYNIHITTSSNLDYLYTGNFSKEKNPEEVLEIIGKPFGIIFKIEP